MNKEFGKTITHLRKKKGVTQKEVCEDLGISQALLSHYEKGIRECGLDFLSRLADYYEVSCDYLLGRTTNPSGGNEIEISDETQTLDEINRRKTNTYCMLNRKLQVNTTSVIYSILAEINNKKLTRYVSEYLSAAQYSVFRSLYKDNKSDELFDLNNPDIHGYCKASIALSEARIKDTLTHLDVPKMNPEILSEKYDDSYTSLHQLIKNTEKALNQSFKI